MAKEKEKSKNPRSEVKGDVGYHGTDISSTNAVPGINTPGIELPAFNPPIPNRAWTAMRAGLDIDNLTEEEKRDLYLGSDNYL